MKYIKIFENYNNIDKILSKYGFDSSIKPEYLYHLTNGDNIDFIKENGLDINYSKKENIVKGIYLADKINVVMSYRYSLKNYNNYYIIEIPFKNLNEKYMKPDDYELFDIIDGEWSDDILKYFNIDEVNGNERMIWENLNYKHSLFICNQLLYTESINKDLFSKIYTPDDDIKY